MLRWNLAFTTKLAYVLSTITLLFLSSAFISLANAGIVDEPGPMSIEPRSGVQGYDPSGENGVQCDYDGLQARYDDHLANQQSYIDRWTARKGEYRMLEEYAAWLRDHEEPGSGNFGPPSPDYSPGLPPIIVSLPTFVDMILSSF